MKIRNAILALGLAIALSFNFSTTLSATTSDIPAVEYAVTGIIDVMLIDNEGLMVTLQTSHTVQLSLVSPNGRTVWSTKTNNETIIIPTSRYASGTYTLIATNKNETQFFPVQLSNSSSISPISGNTSTL
jgi:hypothetical protein